MSTSDTKIVFFGTPAFSVPVLRVLLESGYQLRCVTSAHGSPVNDFAAANGIPVLQPEELDEAFIDELRSFGPDVAVLAAYGKILREPVLQIPNRGFINVHPSLLPKYRGSSPVIHTILGGETVTGASVFVMDTGVDTGPILGQLEHRLSGKEHAGQLTETLFAKGAELLQDLLPEYLSGKLQPTPQDDTQATVTRKVPKDAAVIDWSASDALVERQVRAFDPWPMARTTIGKTQIQLQQVGLSGRNSALTPGSAVLMEDIRRIGLVCGNGKILTIESAKPQDKHMLGGEEFYNGYRKVVAQTE